MKTQSPGEVEDSISNSGDKFVISLGIFNPTD